jgi:hypothetical protein
VKQLEFRAAPFTSLFCAFRNTPLSLFLHWVFTNIFIFEKFSNHTSPANNTCTVYILVSVFHFWGSLSLLIVFCRVYKVNERVELMCMGATFLILTSPIS